jgi:hypothetical protein
MTIIFSNTAQNLSMHGENYGHNHGNCFLQNGKKISQIMLWSVFSIRNGEKMVIFSRIKALPADEIRASLGSQAYFFRACTLREILADVVFAAGAW